MKGNYNILDATMFNVVRDLSQMFDEESIRYSIVGGMAVQIYLAGWHGHNGIIPLKSCHELSEVLRTTGDIDILVDSQETAMPTFFNKFATEHPALKVSNTQNYALIEGVTINYIDNAKGCVGLESVFQENLRDANDVQIKMGNQIASVRVQPLELLIAAKATGNRIRPQDFWDLRTIITAAQKFGVEIDYDKVRKLLTDIGRPERYDTINDLQD